VRPEKKASFMADRICAPGALAVLAFLLLLLPVSAKAAAPKQIVREIGTPAVGVTGGLFNAARGIAVNQTGAGGVPAGTFYIVDASNRRVQRYSPSGAFVSAWGWKVGAAGAEQFEVCTEAESCKRGSAGSGAGQFGNNSAQGIAIDQANGNVYVSDPGALTRRIDIFSAAGAFQGAFGYGVINQAEEFQFCTALTGCGFPGIAEGSGEGGRFPGALGGLAVDASGNIYVANKFERRVDVFAPNLNGGTVVGVQFLRAFGWGVAAGNSEFEVCAVAANCKRGIAGSGLGQFATESPTDVAVDSGANVFALDAGNKRIEKFSPAPLPLAASFGSAALASAFGPGGGLPGELLNIAIDPSNNHLFVSGRRSTATNKIAVAELDPAGGDAVEGGGVHGPELSIISSGGLATAQAPLGGNVYLASATTNVLQGLYVLNASPSITEIDEITGTSAVFKGKVISDGVDVTYHFEYSTDGNTWIKAPPEDVDAGTAPGKIDVEHKVVNLTGSQLYHVRLVQNRVGGAGEATSPETTFTTLAAEPAILGAVAYPVKDTSATLNAYLNPQNEPTTYRFEYGLGDCSASPGTCTALPVVQASGGGLRVVAQNIVGLQPSTVYHYRLIASNATGTTASPDRLFETFSAGAKLSDNRAYELVTPPDTGAVILGARQLGESPGCFDTFTATADGNSVISLAKGGALPGYNVTGAVDLYESVRGPSGWTTIAKSPSGAQSSFPTSVGMCASTDHLFSTFTTGPSPQDEGSLTIEGKRTNYVRNSNGEFTLAGRGEVAGGEVVDPVADVRWISAKGGHIIFTSELPLADDAPPSGTTGIYDRSASGVAEVVSLLPGEVPLATGEDANYQGASVDGSAVAFKVGNALYVREDNAATLEVTPGPSTFAGISSNGDKVFYTDAAPAGSVPPAGLFVFDTASETTSEIAPNSIFVNVAEDGSSAYFLSKSVLTGTETNSQGQEAEAGEHNLYGWDEAGNEVHFIAIVSPEDVKDSGGDTSLVRWVSAAVFPQQSPLTGRANDSSRTTPDGDVLLFESTAALTGYDSGGHIEIYRYEAGTERLDCVSCPPAGTIATGDAHLQVFFGGLSSTSAIVHIQNVTDDGRKVFFQTEEALVPGDVNDVSDVYEWKLGQQAYLLSPGQGALPTYLYGMTPNGSDVFFTSNETLVPEDLSNVSSIYDAREGGGFPHVAEVPTCQEDACQGQPSGPPSLPGAGSASFQGPANPVAKHKKKHKKHKKRKHHHKKHHHKASDNRRAAR
jgi:hypothetical protein